MNFCTDFPQFQTSSPSGKNAQKGRTNFGDGESNYGIEGRIGEKAKGHRRSTKSIEPMEQLSLSSLVLKNG
jgi:hypothetical protein